MSRPLVGGESYYGYTCSIRVSRGGVQVSIESVDSGAESVAGEEDSDSDGVGSGLPADDGATPGSTVLDWSTDLPMGLLGGVDPMVPSESETVDVLDGLTRIGSGEAFLGWARFQSIGVIYDRLVVQPGPSGGSIVDGFADAAARVSGVFAVSRPQAERMIDEAIVLRDDLPQVFGCLREGILSVEQARLIISRTDLVRGPGTASEVVAAVDSQIAETLHTRRGSWKRPRLRDMVDRIVFRQDPDAVRERRERALDRRGVFTDNCGDGVGELTEVMSAENVQIAVAAVRRLADAVCVGDGRTRQQRASDAMFALLSGTRFDCMCAGSDCAAMIPEPGTVPPADARFVIHVVCNEAALVEPDNVESKSVESKSVEPKSVEPKSVEPKTAEFNRAESESAESESAEPDSVDEGDYRDEGEVGGTSRTAHAGCPADPEFEVPVAFMDGHGIISGEHLRDIAARDDARLHRIVPTGTPENADGTFTLPAYGADAYRPKIALDEAIRCRDGYRVDPGCGRSAWSADNDHVTEYDHHDPGAGGPTCYENLNAVSTRYWSVRAAESDRRIWHGPSATTGIRRRSRAASDSRGLPAPDRHWRRRRFPASA